MIEPRALVRARLPLLALAGISLALGGWAGLVRIGWVPPFVLAPPLAHGPALTMGFLGTLVALERSVAYGRSWTHAAPASIGLGALVLLAGLPLVAGQLLFIVGSVALTLVMIRLYRIQPSEHGQVLVVAAAMAVAANSLWLAGVPVARVFPWWAAFLIMTIAGERLELARLTRLSGMARLAFAAAGGLLTLGLILGLVRPGAGLRLAGLGLVSLAAWLMIHDLARRTVRQSGLTRYIAVCLLAGYAWLAMAGALWLTLRFAPGSAAYDAQVHTALVGFVISMTFAHAPIVGAAVLALPLAYAPRFYAHLVLLHVSLVARVAGDLFGRPRVTEWGGVGGRLALTLFVASTALAAITARPVRGKGG